jgi:hypothetical protein
MNINVKRINEPHDIKTTRKMKLNNINGLPKTRFIGFDWNVTPECKEEEDLKYFQLFCISITKDLLAKRFKTTERGEIIYDCVDNIDAKHLIEKLDYLFFNIEDSK